MSSNSGKWSADFIGTFGLTLGGCGCGCAVLAAAFPGVAIGLCLTLIHLVSIPVSNTSVNPARSTGPALFAQTAALGDLWLFWVAPIVGAMLGALIYRGLLADD